ncbi:MAG: BlaI/MecI/CopY family transcriptional regulator [Planctomycetota bacterium]
MVRPKSNVLTDRELAVMQVFWQHEEATSEVVLEELKQQGESLAYVTVANVVRGLLERGFLKQTHRERPYRYRAARTFDSVSKSLVGDLVKRVFNGSRESLLVHVLKQKKLSANERALLMDILDESSDATNESSSTASSRTSKRRSKS